MYKLTGNALSVLLSLKTIGTVNDEDTCIAQSLVDKLTHHGYTIHIQENPVDWDDLSTYMSSYITSDTGLVGTDRHIFMLGLPTQPASAKTRVKVIESMLTAQGFKHNGMAQSLYTPPGRHIGTCMAKENHGIYAGNLNDFSALLYSLYTIIVAHLVASQDEDVPITHLNYIDTAYKGEGVRPITLFRELFKHLLPEGYIEELRQRRIEEAAKALNDFMSNSVRTHILDAKDSAERKYKDAVQAMAIAHRSIKEAEIKIYALDQGLNDTDNFGTFLHEAHEDGLLSGYYFDVSNNKLYITMDSYLMASTSLSHVIRSTERQGRPYNRLTAELLRMLEEGQLKIPVSDTIRISFRSTTTMTIDSVDGVGELYNMEGDVIPRATEWGMKNTHISSYNCFAHGKSTVKKYFMEGKIDQMFAAAAEAVGNFNFYDGDVAPHIHSDIIHYLRNDGLIKIRTPEGWQTAGGRELYEKNYND